MKNIIEQKVIDNLPPIYVDGISEEENQFVNDWIKYLLQYAKEYNDSNEAGAILDKTDWNNADIVLGGEHHVTFNTDKMLKWMDEGNDNLILIHNHPSNNAFSEKDLYNFCRTKAVNTMIVAGNKGTIYLAQKLREFDGCKVIQYYTETKKLNKNIIFKSKIIEFILENHQSALNIKFVKEEIL